jgi:GAF domain-containing protein
MEAQATSYFNSFKEIVRAVNSTLDLKEVLTLLVTEVTKVINLKGCAIRLVHPEKHTLEMVSSHGLSKRYINKGPVDADRSIAASLEGEIVIVEDVTQDPRIQYPEEAIKEGIRSIVSVPLRVKNDVIGVLRVFTAQPHFFSDDEIDFLTALADMGTIAIENARMYENMKKDYRTLMKDYMALVRHISWLE